MAVRMAEMGSTLASYLSIGSEKRVPAATVEKSCKRRK